MKKVIKSIIFLLIFCILFHNIINILWLEKNPISYFYEEPKNSLDIAYIGSSTVFCHFNSVLAYDLYGYTTGLLTSPTQPFIMIKYIIEECKKYQEPKLYIIDTYQFASQINTYHEEVDFRKVVDSMKFSNNRTAAINTFLQHIDLEQSNSNFASGNDFMNYEFSFLLYHNIWKDLTKDNFIGPQDYYKGYHCSEETVEINSQKTYHWKENTTELPEENEQILIDLINYINENKLNVLFVVPPRVYSKGRNTTLNQIINILTENGFDVINFNTLEDFDIDYSKELFNGSHMNVYGATKYTLYLSKYLKEHYDLPNHKGDAAYASWESEYVRFKKDFKDLTKKDFNTVLTKYSN